LTNGFDPKDLCACDLEAEALSPSGLGLKERSPCGRELYGLLPSLRGLYGLLSSGLDAAGLSLPGLGLNDLDGEDAVRSSRPRDDGADEGCPLRQSRLAEYRRWLECDEKTGCRVRLRPMACSRACSSPVNGRQAPGLSTSSFKGPCAMRVRRTTSCPTSWHISLT